MCRLRLDSSEKSFDFSWNRTQVAAIPVGIADHSAIKTNRPTKKTILSN